MHTLRFNLVRMHNKTPRRFDVVRLQDDMHAKGWMPIDLARAAGVSHMSVSRFLRCERQTPRMAKKLADAIGYSIRRYLVVGEAASA
jgi:transcriptional regulator with XRE-family HTH domain